MTLSEITRLRRKKNRSKHFLSGASTISVAGSNRTARFVAAALSQNGWAVDSANIRGDFEKAMERANLDR